jgi:hypothetical protein
LSRHALRVELTWLDAMTFTRCHTVVRNASIIVRFMDVEKSSYVGRRGSVMEGSGRSTEDLMDTATMAFRLMRQAVKEVTAAMME